MLEIVSVEISKFSRSFASAETNLRIGVDIPDFMLWFSHDHISMEVSVFAIQSDA